MGFQVVETGPTERRLEIEVPAERVGAEFERVFRSVSSSARVRGFRPGRVPRPVLQRLVGEEVRARAAESLVREAVAKALVESELPVVSAPEIDLGEFDEHAALHFSARFEIRPEVPEVDLEGLAVARTDATVSAEDVDRVLERLRDRHAELVSIEGRKELARGDFATIRIEVLDGGKPVEILSRPSATVEVGAGHLPPEVDERLSLVRVDDSFSVEAPAPEGAPPEISGRILSWTVAVLSIAEKRMPLLDDEFARDHGECATLAELRTRVEDSLREDGDRRADAAVRDALLDTLLARVSLELPPSLVRERTAALLEDFRLQLAIQGMRFTSPAHEDEAREKLQPRAEREVKAGLVLDRVVQQLDLAGDDETITTEIERLAASAARRGGEIRQHYAEASARAALATRMLRARALETLVARAGITLGVSATTTE